MQNKIQSLGYRTDFIFNKCDGSIEFKDKYVVATTKSNPNYFWGNLLLYPAPPKKGDLESWTKDFKEEFTNPQIYHMTFAWDSTNGEQGDVSEFISEGFDLESSIVLSTNKVETPKKFNSAVGIKLITEEVDYNKCVEIQVLTSNDYLSEEAWKGFYKKSMDQYRELIRQKKGFWFGAILDNQIVGSLGVFIEDDIARFQIVSTSPDYQRRGVCSTLVYESAKYVLENTQASTLVMVADEDYHAAKIYESVGFIPTEKQIGLCWFDKARS
jgi:ribosomal protein S18 acetylase RimI-like enzyme